MFPALADALAAARRTGRQHNLATVEAPADASSAYRVQADVARLLNTTVAGWKVGFGPDPSRTPIAGPIFSCDMRPNGGIYKLAPGERVKVEIELAFRLRIDLPTGVLHRDGLLDAALDWFVGIELVGTRYADPDAAPFEARLADNVNNSCYVIGSGAQSLGGLDIFALPCRLRINGETIADHPSRHADLDPLSPALAWAAHQADACGGLKAGQFVTTGCLNTPLDIDGPAAIEAELGGVGRAALKIVA